MLHTAIEESIVDITIQYLRIVADPKLDNKVQNKKILGEYVAAIFQAVEYTLPAMVLHAQCTPTLLPVHEIVDRGKSRSALIEEIAKTKSCNRAFG